MYSIYFTELAKQDLFSIFELISKDKPSVAIEYIDKLESNIELLTTNPKLGIECKNRNIDKDCRILIFENYLIFYRIVANYIHIGRILNSRQDYIAFV